MASEEETPLSHEKMSEEGTIEDQEKKEAADEEGNKEHLGKTNERAEHEQGKKEAALQTEEQTGKMEQKKEEVALTARQGSKQQVGLPAEQQQGNGKLAALFGAEEQDKTESSFSTHLLLDKKQYESNDALKEHILDPLQAKGVDIAFLYGRQGVGKTWIAQEIRKNSSHIFSKTLWVSLNNKDDDEMSILKRMASQLSLITIAEEQEDDDDNDTAKLEEEDLQKLDVLRLRIREKLADVSKHIKEPDKDKKLLLILDGCNGKFLPYHNYLTFIIPPNVKFLITLRSTYDLDGSMYIVPAYFFHVRPLSEEESELFLRPRLDSEIVGTLSKYQQLWSDILRKCGGLPASLKTVAKALNCIKRNCHDHGWDFETALQGENHPQSPHCAPHWSTDRVLHCWYGMLRDGILKKCYWYSKLFFSQPDNASALHYTELIGHWIIGGYLDDYCHIENAYVKGHQVMLKLMECGMLNSTEDDRDYVSVEGAMLGMNDDRNRGFIGASDLELADQSVWDYLEGEGLGRLLPSSGMMKTPCSLKQLNKVTTLMIDGIRLRREVPNTFFQQLQFLRVLAIFNPRFKSLPASFSELKELAVLVLRGCDALESVDGMRTLKKLAVLEISGADSLIQMQDNLFDDMDALRSVHISAANITSLPKNLFNQHGLRYLILRGCSHLNILPGLGELENLEVIDLSGSTSFKRFRCHPQECFNQKKLRHLMLCRCSQLETLPSLKQLTSLEVIDLSGATSFKRFTDRDFSKLRKLQMLDLSQTDVEFLPFLNNLGALTQLVLTSCKSLNRLPKFEGLSSLQILDVSGSSTLKDVRDKTFYSKVGLKILNLSGTAINSLPPEISNLCRLYLRDCNQLATLPSTTSLEALELLDLSGAGNLSEIQDSTFQHLKFLQVLIMSKLKVTKIPSLANLANLRHLEVNDCLSLEELPQLEGLTKVEILKLSGCAKLVKLPNLESLEKLDDLDLSSCCSLEEIPNTSFDHNPHLRILNLSETKITHIPSLSNSTNLTHLILKDCPNLKNIPTLENASKLEELNLCGKTCLSEFNVVELDHMKNLQVLDISGTQVKQLSSMPKLVNLRHLSLAGISSTEILPDLQAFSKLEILDLSRTKAKQLPPLTNFSNLRQLLLRDCLELQQLPDFGGQSSNLEVLNLWGTRINEFPYTVLESTLLKRLDLPKLENVTIDWGKIKYLPAVNWDECGLFTSSSVTHQASNKPSILLIYGTNFFHFMEKSNPSLWGTCFNEFQFWVPPPKDQAVNFTDTHFLRAKLNEEDVYFLVRHVPSHQENFRYLEICGSQNPLEAFKNALQYTEYICLGDNDMNMNSLWDAVGDHLKNMKGCWVERCNNMKCMFSGKEVNEKMERNLEMVWVSNLPKLETLCGRVEMKYEMFSNLKHVYLDSCQMLETVFTEVNMPENLETLHVKFCNNVKTIFGGNNVEESFIPRKLESLYLLELPELLSIGTKKLPPLKTCIIWECPKFFAPLIEM